jgi:hypothetical protein
VDYATRDGSAKAGEDYVAASGRVSFTHGRAKSISVCVEGDLLNEPDEAFDVVLSNPSREGASLSKGVVTIRNDDARPLVSIGPATVGEGDSGTTPALFPVVLSAPTSQQVTVDWIVAGSGTAPASAGSDFASDGQTHQLTFAGGQTKASIQVDVLGDTNLESDETFTVALSNPVNADLGSPSSALGTIIDDEAQPAASIGDAAPVTEGDGGTTVATFHVRLSNDPTGPVSVDYSTEDGSAKADGTGVAESDYVAETGSVTFQPGEALDKVVEVDVNGDEVHEGDEDLSVSLTNVSGGTPADTLGSATIVDDDSIPTISLRKVSVLEGQKGTSTAYLPVQLSNPTVDQVTVTLSSTNGSAQAGSDYQALDPSAAMATFAPGEAGTQFVAAQVIGDRVLEPNERFNVSLEKVENANVADGTSVVKIRNDDTATHVHGKVRHGKVRTRGWVSPNRHGRRVKATLFKRSHKHWVKVRTKHPRLSARTHVNKDSIWDGRFHTRFANPKHSAKCKIVAVYPPKKAKDGSIRFHRSKTKDVFGC